LDHLTNDVDIPFVFLGPAALANASVRACITSHAVQLSQLVESFQTRRDEATAHLFKLKEILRQQTNVPGSEGLVSDMPLELREVSLCECVLKLHISLTMMASRYVTFVNELRQELVSAGLSDMSSSLDSWKISITETLSSPSLPVKNIDCSKLSKERALQYLGSNSEAQRVPQSIVLLRGLRLAQIISDLMVDSVPCGLAQ
jgi:hypothetical protein